MDNKKWCARRFVIFAGPGKTGSTSIQSFYGKYAIGKLKSTAFANWTLPGGAGDSVWCGHLCSNNPKRRRIANKAKTMAEEIKETMKNDNGVMKNQGRSDWPPQNLFWACEFVANATALGKSKLVGLMEDADMTCPEYVINYRTPRVEHFLSAWKQITRNEPDNPRTDIMGLSPMEFMARYRA